MKKFFPLFVHLTVCMVFLLGSCGPTAQNKNNGWHVLAAETFLGDIAQNVAGNRLKVDVLLPPTVDPHEFQPTPRDSALIAESQMLIVNGFGYEAWLTKAFENTTGNLVVLEAAKGLTPNPDPSGEHADGDPHLWMNPLNVIRYVENIRDGLSHVDPSGKDMYAANAEAYISKLKDLDEWIKNEVAQIPPERRLIVTNHDALGYFARAYNFKIVGAVIPSVTTEAAPSAQQMADLIDMIKSSGARAIFLDAGENQNLADQIAAESDARVITGLYVESLSTAEGPASTYIDMIKHDVTIIVETLK